MDTRKSIDRMTCTNTRRRGSSSHHAHHSDAGAGRFYIVHCYYLTGSGVDTWVAWSDHRYGLSSVGCPEAKEGLAGWRSVARKYYIQFECTGKSPVIYEFSPDLLSRVYPGSTFTQS